MAELYISGNLRITPANLDRLQAAAARVGLSAAEAARVAVEDWTAAVERGETTPATAAALERAEERRRERWTARRRGG